MAANAFFCSRIVGEPFAYTTTTDMENIYVECIEQILQVAPPVEEARELIMRVVKQELQYTDLLTEAQKEEAIGLLTFMQFPLKIKQEIFMERLYVHHASLPAIGIGLAAGLTTSELLNKQPRLLRLPLAALAGAAFGSIYSLCIEKPVKMPRPRTTKKEEIVSTAEEIQQDIERLIAIFVRLGKEQTMASLKNDLDTLAWLQASYVDAERFGAEGQTYLQRRIEQQLAAHGLRLVAYSDADDVHFENIPTDKVETDWPAIAEGEQLILPGKHFVQMEKA